MKQRTPMKRMHSNFVKFDAIMAELVTKRIELNYQNNLYREKHIESDFLRVYFIDHKYSFSFKFDFYQDDKKTIRPNEEQFVTVILKEHFNVGEPLFFESRKMIVEDANKMLRILNKDLPNANLQKPFHLYSFIKAFFVESKNEISQDQFMDEFKKYASVHFGDLLHLNDEKERFRLELEKSTVDFNNSISELPENKRIEELERKIAELNKTRDEKVKNLKAFFLIDKKTKKLQNASSKVKIAYSKVEEKAIFFLRNVNFPSEKAIVIIKNLLK